mmetsp:Transcript_31504/g.57072  ORF Transcript_31504/g.57072 Transcript_31504/m.57072 type:complete len:118 (-) Transcript_31504:18-371(-)
MSTQSQINESNVSPKQVSYPLVQREPSTRQVPRDSHTTLLATSCGAAGTVFVEGDAADFADLEDEANGTTANTKTANRNGDIVIFYRGRSDNEMPLLEVIADNYLQGCGGGGAAVWR